MPPLAFLRTAQNWYRRDESTGTYTIKMSMRLEKLQVPVSFHSLQSTPPSCCINILILKSKNSCSRIWRCSSSTRFWIHSIDLQPPSSSSLFITSVGVAGNTMQHIHVGNLPSDALPIQVKEGKKAEQMVRFPLVCASSLKMVCALNVRSRHIPIFKRTNQNCQERRYYAGPPYTIVQRRSQKGPALVSST